LADNHTGSSKGPLKKFLDWWLAPTTSRGANLLLGVLATAVTAALGSAAALALKGLDVVDFEDDWPAWLVAAAVAIALAVGATLGALITRALFKPHRAVRERLEAYARHLVLLQRDLGTNSFPHEAEILATLDTILEKGIQTEVCVSRWEPDGEKKWKLTHSPDHTQHENEVYGAVPMSESWIAAMQGPASDDPFRIDDLKDGTYQGQDLLALEDFGFRSLICARISLTSLANHSAGPHPCLVVLAKEPYAFTKGEARYLQFLARLMGTQERIAELEANRL
jgi:hypothetical protein